MTDKQQLRWYTVWSDEHPSHAPEQVQVYCARSAVKLWFNAHWCGLGRPDQARVYARCVESAKLAAYDVSVEDIELELDVARVAIDANGRELSTEEIHRRLSQNANHARSVLLDAFVGEEPAR